MRFVLALVFVFVLSCAYPSAPPAVPSNASPWLALGCDTVEAILVGLGKQEAAQALDSASDAVLSRKAPSPLCPYCAGAARDVWVDVECLDRQTTVDGALTCLRQYNAK